MDVSVVVSFGACDGLVGIISSYRPTARRCDDSLHARFACSRVRVTRQARLGGDFTPSTFEFQRPACLTISPFGQQHRLFLDAIFNRAKLTMIRIYIQ